ncbi:unnamed protein product, partial [Symbiodinium sp. CCMP2456]
ATLGVHGRGGQKPATADPKWRLQEQEIRETLPLQRQSARPWSEGARLQGIAITDRIKALVDVAFLKTEDMLKQRKEPHARQDVARSLFADLSQNIVRMPWGRYRTLTTSTQLYSFERDRLLVPEELLVILGFPRTYAESARHHMKNRDITDLVGMAMAVPSVTVVCCSALMAALRFLPGLAADVEVASQDRSVVNST